MNNEKQGIIDDILEYLFAQFNRPPSPTIGQVWDAALYPLTYNDLVHGFQRFTREYKGITFPTPAVFIDFCLDQTTDDAENAWNVLQNALQKISPYVTVWFADKAITNFIREKQGWPALNRILERDIPFLNKEFVSNYNRLKANPVKGTPYLPGIDKKPSQIKYIGFTDEEKSQLMIDTYKNPVPYISDKETASKLRSIFPNENKKLPPDKVKPIEPGDSQDYPW